MGSTTIKLKRKRAQLWLHMGLALTVVYFAYHTLSGRNGLFALMQLQNQVQYTQMQADQLTFDRVALEHRIERLSTNIDLDLLDEQARKQLGYVGKNEQVIMLKD